MKIRHLVLIACVCFFSPVCSAGQALPFYDQIIKIIEPLTYSGFPIIVKPQVSLSVDFEKREWTLRNIHTYDQRGRVILEQNKFGLCAELATYVFEKIKPFLTDRYEVKFAMVTERAFFSKNQSNHIVLLLFDKADGQAYLIDPSFHRYARAKDLPEYQVVKVQDSLVFETDRSPDFSFNAQQALPLYIKDDFLLSFSMTAVDGKFDKDNFAFVISATKKYQFASRDIIIVGKREKVLQDFEDEPMLKELLSFAEAQLLFNRLKGWINQL
ncbi:MAG: hypothetical protein HQL13_05285 [Candidatus Omnitrophica bacterium]|nr:hypothetical protein [Candidatus Omnitrophota bacterium]